MNCDAYKALLHRVLDGETISGEEQAAMQQHEKQCMTCRAEGERLYAVHAQCARLDEESAAPEDFAQSWRKAVRAEAAKKRRFSSRAMVSVAAGVLVFALGGLSMMESDVNGTEGAPQLMMSRTATTADYGANYSMKSAAYDASAEWMAVEEAAEEESETTQKRIRTASIQLRTVEFDHALEQLRSLSTQYGGYVGSEELYGVAGEESRRAYMDVYVKATELDTCLAQMVALGELQSRSVSVMDVTKDYVDTSGRLESAKARRDRLLELTAQAQDMSELIELEDALSEVQTTIEQHERSLQAWDQRVEYATIHVNVQEKRVQEAVREGDEGLLVRMQSALEDSMEWLWAFAQGVLVFAVAALPMAAIVGVLALLGWQLAKRRKKRKK